MSKKAIKALNGTTQTIATIKALQKERCVWYVERREKDGAKECREYHQIWFVTLWDDSIVRIYASKEEK